MVFWNFHKFYVPTHSFSVFSLLYINTQILFIILKILINWWKKDGIEKIWFKTLLNARKCFVKISINLRTWFQKYFHYFYINKRNKLLLFCRYLRTTLVCLTIGHSTWRGLALDFLWCQRYCFPELPFVCEVSVKEKKLSICNT